MFNNTPNPNILTEKEKEIIQEQNNLIRFFLAEKYNIKDYVITRDKKYHPIIVTYNNDDKEDYLPVFSAYMLGFNINTNQLLLYNVGRNTFKPSHLTPEDVIENKKKFDCFNITKLAVHAGFSNLSIGKILLQCSENYSIENAINHLTLSSLKSYVPFDTRDIPHDLKQINQSRSLTFKNDANQNSKLSKYNEFIVKNYFNKNLYFYLSYGFTFDIEHTYRFDLHSDFNNLIKNNLEYVNLTYGYTKKKSLYTKKDKLFAFKVENNNPYTTLTSHPYTSLFYEYINPIPSEEFSPFITLPTQEDLTKLKKILSLECEELKTINQKERIEYYVNSYQTHQTKYCKIYEDPTILNKLLSDKEHNIEDDLYTQESIYNNILNNDDEDEPNC